MLIRMKIRLFRFLRNLNIDFAPQNKQSQFWYKYDNQYIAPHTTSIHGTSFLCKTTVYDSIKYIRSIVIDRNKSFENADIEIIFFKTDKSYVYRIQTSNECILSEKFICCNNNQEILNCKGSHINIRSNDILYNWFKSIIFIDSTYENSTDIPVNHNINETLLSKYRDCILNNTVSIHYATASNSHGYLIFYLPHNNQKQIFLKDLSRSTLEFFSFLHIIDSFIYCPDESILIIDDADYIAKGKIKSLLDKRFVSVSVDQYYNSAKQLIAFCNDITSNTFAKSTVANITNFAAN